MDRKRNDRLRPVLCCRICLEEEIENNKLGGSSNSRTTFSFTNPVSQGDNRELISPCSCKGSSAYVHRECLMKWRLANYANKNKRDVCTVCLTPFHFENSSTEQRTRLVYSIGLRFGALLAIIPVGLIASVLLPLLPRRGIVQDIGGIHSQPSTRSFVVDHLWPQEPAVDLTGLDVALWRQEVFGKFISPKVLSDINQLILQPDSGLKFITNFNFLPGILWGCARVGSIGFYLSYFLNGSILDLLSNSAIEQFPRTRWFPQGIIVIVNYIFFCASLRAIRTPSRRRGLPLFLFSTLLGLYSIYRRIYTALRSLVILHDPSFALLEFGQISSRPHDVVSINDPQQNIPPQVQLLLLEEEEEEDEDDDV